MKYLFLFAVLVLILIVPANAANITITAEPLGGSLNILPSHQSSYTVDVSKLQRNAIQRLTVDIPTDTTISYTLWYGNGTTISGQMIYNKASSTNCGDPTGLVGYCQYSKVSIGAMSSDHYYVGLQEIGRIDIVGYGRNEDTGQRLFIIYDSTGGLHIPGDAMAYSEIPSGVIYKFTITANKPITSCTYYTNTKENVQKASETSLLDVIIEWANLLVQIKDTVIEVFWFFFYVAQFMWDNIYLIIALYFGLTGAIAANQSKDIFAAIKKWFGYQRSLLNFILGTWDTVIGLITKILK